MVIQYQRTVWFPKDLVLAIVVLLPFWGIGGVFWGIAMSIAVDGGNLWRWLMLGGVWGLACWFLFSIFVSVACREVVTTVSISDPLKTADRLSEVAKPLRYTVEKSRPTVFVCRPRRWLARRFQCNTVQIQLQDAFVELTGPAMIVKRLAKGLAG